VSTLIASLNSLSHLPPDEIAKSLADPFSQWVEAALITPEDGEKLRGRRFHLYHHDGGEQTRGFFCTNRTYFTSSYSYRTMDPVHSDPQRSEEYTLTRMAELGHYWLIADGYHLTAPVPTTAAAQTPEDFYDNDDDENYDEDVD
jgi:hypothetical protein